MWDGVNGAIGAVAYLLWQPSGFRPKHQPITWLIQACITCKMKLQLLNVI